MEETKVQKADRLFREKLTGPEIEADMVLFVEKAREGIRPVLEAVRDGEQNIDRSIVVNL